MRRFDIHFSLVVFIILLSVNVLFLDRVTFSKKEDVSDMAPVSAPAFLDTGKEMDCNQSCMKIIDKKFEEYSATQKLTLSPTSQPFTANTIEANEYYIPLGSGVTRNSEWEDLAGVEAYLDTTNYPRIKSVIFEAHFSITTGQGQMYAKLYNVTDKHDVWFSELSVDGGGMVRREAEIALEPGKKLYKVMAKSTLRAEANVLNARIRILTK